MSSVRRRLLAAIAGSSGPLAIGDAFMGGYYAGIIDTTVGNIIAADAYQTGARYALILAPASLVSTSLKFQTTTATFAAAKTRWDGLSATTAMNSSTWPAAQYCAAQTAPSDGASGWYLPAMDELELIYRNFKPTTANNYTTADAGSTFPSGSISPGANPSSDPVGTAYTTTVPAQTPVTAFQSGGSEALGSATARFYWSATEYASGSAWSYYFGGASTGNRDATGKTGSMNVRPVRRLLL